MRQTLTLKISPHIAGAAAWTPFRFLPRKGHSAPISADTIDFLDAGDHKAGRVTVTNPLGPRRAPPPVIGNVSHWPSSLFCKLSRHISQWSKAHLTNQDHIMHPFDRADAIIAAASSFVQGNPLPQPVQDPVDQQLADELHRNPTSKRAQQAWAHHRATNNMKRAQRHPRHFQKCAVRGRSTFFNALKWWPITPFRMNSPQPDTTLAAEHFPYFAGDPPWRPEEAKALLSQVLKPSRPVSPDPPLWQSFTKALRQPKTAGMDYVAPHPYQWSPGEVHWDLYIAVRHVWESGDVPHHWLQTRIAMIYKSAPPEAARSYWPISVATRMYSILARLVLDTLRGSIDAALSDPQAGCRRGYTTSQQALRMSMLLHQFGDGALVCLVDIAKADPSIPHECLTYGLRSMGTPAQIYNMVASIYAHSTGVYGDVRFPLHRGIKEGCPHVTNLFCSGV